MSLIRSTRGSTSSHGSWTAEAFLRLGTSRPADGDQFEPGQFNAIRDRRDAQLADRRRLVHRRPLPRQQDDRGRHTDLDRRRQRRQRRRIWSCAAARCTSSAMRAGPGLPTRRPAGVGSPAGPSPRPNSACRRRRRSGRPLVGRQRPLRHPDDRVLRHSSPGEAVGGGLRGLVLEEDAPRRERPRAREPQGERRLERGEERLALADRLRRDQPSVRVDQAGLAQRGQQLRPAAEADVGTRPVP